MGKREKKKFRSIVTMDKPFGNFSQVSLDNIRSLGIFFNNEALKAAPVILLCPFLKGFPIFVDHAFVPCQCGPMHRLI